MASSSLSVALCTYNGARFIPQQLASYAEQDRLPSELVVCDDGSTDGTLQMLREFAATSPFPVRIEINDPRLGVAANFGRAIALCRSDIIALSDQDDVWRRDKVSRLHRAFAEDPQIGMAFSDANAVDESGAPMGYMLWDAVRFTQRERATAREGRLLDVLLKHYVVTGATLAFRSEFKSLILPIPLDCLHDAWIATLIASVAQGALIDEPLIDYRQHPTQTSGGERILSLFEQVRRARSQQWSDHQLTARRFAAAGQRLAESRYADGSRDAIAKFEQKVFHFEARSRAQRDRHKRLPLVLGELATGRYFRYSHAWKAALTDLFL